MMNIINRVIPDLSEGNSTEHSKVIYTKCGMRNLFGANPLIITLSCLTNNI